MSNNKKFRLEVCVSPAIYPKHADDNNIVVIVDILRATSAIVTALSNGAKAIIPVSTVEEAREKKEEGFMVACERDGYVKDFADFGNSPFNFTKERVHKKEIVYSTTNGTRCIHLAAHSKQVVIGSYLNISALSRYLINSKSNVLIFCASWKDRFSLEDTVFAGALSEKLIHSGKFESICDAVTASMDLWKIARNDLHKYSLKAAQKQRLASKGLDDCIEFCHTLDFTEIVPKLDSNRLIPEYVNKIIS